MTIKEIIGETTFYEKKVMLEERKAKNWLKTVSAYSNKDGGVILFGIEDETDEVVGIENPKRTTEVISELIKSKMDPIPTFSLEIYSIDEKVIVCLRIKEGEETPYYYIGDGNRVAFVRVGNETVVADWLQLKQLFLKGAKTTYDCLPSKYTFEELSFSKLKAVYRHRTGMTFENSFFLSFGLVDEKGVVTNAGVLLSDECPVRHSRIFCTRWNGNDKSGGLSEAIDDVEIEGSLIFQLQESLSFVRRNTKKAWKKEDDGRAEFPEYPERAVLEAIVNAIIHRDYLCYVSEVHIDIYDNRLEVYSPGGMCDGTKIQDNDIYNISSKRRNPILADIFNRLHYMDRRGSGFKKMVEYYEFQRNYNEELKPIFFSNNNDFYIVLKNLNFSNESMTLIECDTQNDTQNDTQSDTRNKKTIELIKELIEKNRNISRKEMAQLIGKSVSTLQRILNETENIRYEGSSKNGYWIIED